MFKKNRGFTLIELLVVIAIIGILSTIVIVALRGSKDKASDVEIKNILSQTKNLQALDFSNGVYSGVCYGPSKILDAVIQAAKISGFNSVLIDDTPSSPYAPLCNSNYDPTRWAAFVPLKSDPNKAWCVDYTGILRMISIEDFSGLGLYDSCIE
jgi:prepilin-type N-terminal cleavage/methylation domain-containing protein